jgi:precorrin-6Y C5,15-methyltransferase (decarboxylating) CbiT subunit
MTAHDPVSDRLRGVFALGLPDELFARGDAPMTKMEIRALTMAAARLRPRHRVLDIGAGTGSLSIEAALLFPEGEVLALERDPAALELIRENAGRFGLANVRVIAGEAPAAFADFAPASFDRILVGGSGGNLAAILEALPALLRAGGRVVCNTACLETTAAVAAALRRPPWSDFACSQISVARGVSAGPLLRFDALNPVWVTSADFESAS